MIDYFAIVHLCVFYFIIIFSCFFGGGDPKNCTENNKQSMVNINKKSSIPYNSLNFT